jgi:hypothetical protein
VFTNEKLKLNTLVGGQVEVVAHLDHPLTVLGYMPEHARVYCVDTGMNVSSFELSLSLVKYKSAVVAGDLGEAEKLFTEIPASYHTKLARFLEHQGYRSEALEITKDADHKFELAITLGLLDVAGSCVEESDKGKRKILGDKALEMGDIALAQKNFEMAHDASSMLLLASCTGEKALVSRVVSAAKSENKLNVELTAQFMVGDVDGCVDTLVRQGMIGQAMMFARSYCGQQKVAELFPIWKADIAKTNIQLANALAEPTGGRPVTKSAVPAIVTQPAPGSPKHIRPEAPVSPKHVVQPAPLSPKHVTPTAPLSPKHNPPSAPSPPVVTRPAPPAVTLRGPPAGIPARPTPPGPPTRPPTLAGPPPGVVGAPKPKPPPENDLL